eukprot:CAMPEP_0115131556 /NCGR_PEP_ID=MMETSP0227-20121206/53197_1 /TAXON_ID=89957 /ORGANISM="Polarella glacialis, Strain CCMP 1383" /LENGTH=59 /DNA_ID=CAMNT_0002537119 /DNA_START=35 /DNA_END=211 /DNA_ORIENTATION=+
MSYFPVGSQDALGHEPFSSQYDMCRSPSPLPVHSFSSKRYATAPRSLMPAPLLEWTVHL